jgi:DNA-binding LacI/PurR family transcriptional regulator
MSRLDATESTGAAGAAPRGPRRPAAMGDVARLAGVSHQTVSRVINGGDKVAPDTRVRVEEAMRLLDYRPSSVARALVTGRSRTIGVIGFNTTLYGPASTMYGIERAAYDANYLTSVVSMPDLDRESVLRASERLRRHNVEGMLAVAPHQAAIAAVAQLSAQVPIVCVEAGPESIIASVQVDQRGGARAATQHLLELGHANVLHIAGPTDWQEAEIRLAGWRDTLLGAGITPASPVFGDWSSASGYALGAEIARQPEVSAVFCSNDQMALGLLRALTEAGRRVPQDISVVGFDATPESGYFNPPLTTVRQDFIEVGREGFRLLRRLIDAQQPADSQVVIPFELIVRESTAPPAVSQRRSAK